MREAAVGGAKGRARAPAACVVLAVCTANVSRTDGERGPWRTGIRVPAAECGDPEGPSRADVMFAPKMIPHHQQAVDMSEFAIERTADLEVRVLAMGIRDAQTPEIELRGRGVMRPCKRSRSGPGPSAPQTPMLDLMRAPLFNVYSVEIIRAESSSLDRMGEHHARIP